VARCDPWFRCDHFAGLLARLLTFDSDPSVSAASARFSKYNARFSPSGLLRCGSSRAVVLHVILHMPPAPSLRASSRPLACSLLIFAQDCPFPGAVACRPPGLRGGRSCRCSPPCWPPAPRPVRRPRSRARSSAGNLRLNASTTLYRKIFTFSLECALEVPCSMFS
jgi:hypothetical protein